jgi:hypothetical protein
VEYLIYLEAKYPQVSEALRAIAAACKSHPELVEYESSFIKAAEVDPHILSQFSTFLQHEEDLEQEFRAHKP